MSWIWILFGALAAFAGLRHRAKIKETRGHGGPPRVDDEALRSILHEGRISTPEDEPLDMEEAAEAEDDFWGESSWEEPEEL